MIDNAEVERHRSRTPEDFEEIEEDDHYFVQPYLFEPLSGRKECTRAVTDFSAQPLGGRDRPWKLTCSAVEWTALAGIYALFFL